MIVLATAASPQADPVSTCRAAHADDAVAHIACLEEALRSQSTAPPAGLGSDQVQSRERARSGVAERVTVQIVSVAYDAVEKGTFRTSNGQVWRETEVTPKRYRLSTAREYKARIERGAFGGYRMYVDGVKWMLKIERLE